MIEWSAWRWSIEHMRDSIIEMESQTVSSRGDISSWKSQECMKHRQTKNIVKVITALVNKNRIKRELEARRTDQIWVISSHWRRANRPFERNNSKFFSPLFRSRLLCSMAKTNGCNDHKGKSNTTRFLENKTKENESKARKLQFATFAIFWGSLRLEECLMTSGSSGKLGHRHTIKVVRPLL